MGIVSGGGGGGGPAAGHYLPAGSQTQVALDTTTYNDPILGAGKLATLVTTGGATALAIANAGDAFPRYIFDSRPSSGIYFGDGTFDPYASTANIAAFVDGGTNVFAPGLIQKAWNAKAAVRLDDLSPAKTVTSGALPTVQLVTATGAQILTTRDAETITPCTFNPGAATTATVTVALSPDNVTYSTLGVVTEPAGVALDGTILLVSVRVPAGWYLKLTVNAQAVLGLTTYY